MTLCHRISEATIHHFINSISKARHVKYLQFLQTIVKCDTYIKRTQDLVMREVGLMPHTVGNFKGNFFYFESQKLIPQNFIYWYMKIDV